MDTKEREKLVKEDHVFDDYLPLSAERIAPGEYIITAKDGRKLGYVEGRSLAEWFCASINSHAELLAAAQMVLAGLNARIEDAGYKCQPVLVYDGIADLHTAIFKATGEE